MSDEPVAEAPEPRRSKYVDKGHKIGVVTKPPGKDTRPWMVLDPDNNIAARMWYEETAVELARMMGKGYKAARVIRRRKKITS
jgi:hypothetical protein